MILGMAKVEAPVQFDMFAGIMMKIRVSVDVALLLSLPAFRNTNGSSPKNTAARNNSASALAFSEATL